MSGRSSNQTVHEDTDYITIIGAKRKVMVTFLDLTVAFCTVSILGGYGVLMKINEEMEKGFLVSDCI